MAARLANREQILLYFRTGKLITEKIELERWGSKVVEQIAVDLQTELPGIKGFSYRNLMNMRQFYVEYQSVIILQTLPAELQSGSILPSLAAELEHIFSISFSHHLLIISKCPDPTERTFYTRKAADEFWSLRTLEHHIKNRLYSNQGKLPNNFPHSLSKEIGVHALNVFQDAYLFDFINLDENANEKVLETEIVSNIKHTIMALGKGFTFISNQYRIEVGGQEFFIDLLFYNRHLQCLVAFELKNGHFKPEHAGQLNFYLNVLDDKVKLPHEKPSIGIILCREKNNTVVEYAFRNITNGMGAATFRTTRSVPDEMKGILPNVKELSRLL